MNLTTFKLVFVDGEIRVVHKIANCGEYVPLETETLTVAGEDPSLSNAMQAATKHSARCSAIPRP